jgi:hypothetical protein
VKWFSKTILLTNPADTNLIEDKQLDILLELYKMVIAILGMSQPNWT